MASQPPLGRLVHAPGLVRVRPPQVQASAPSQARRGWLCPGPLGRGALHSPPRGGESELAGGEKSGHSGDPAAALIFAIRSFPYTWTGWLLSPLAAGQCSLMM